MDDVKRKAEELEAKIAELPIGYRFEGTIVYPGSA